jgi:hypothetical protein
MKSNIPVPLYLLLCASPLAAGAPVQFNRDIRPILSDNCFACHGPDKANRKADLRLDQAGDFDRAEFMNRVLSTDEDEIMPPPKSHKKLSSTQIELLKRWIAEGAKYEAHWAYQSLKTITVPTLKDLQGAGAELAKWPRNEIDWFVLKKLLEAGLRPAAAAEPGTLARRMALDLTGLPVPSEAPRDTSALMDQLFKSPHYGERMAVEWLDAARFADTQGYQVDRDQAMHPFRDWVIAAYNRNLRFDQFTIEQLAGDLLPDATLEQKVATGFHRNHMVNVEGGIIPAEFIAEYTADRVETTAGVWMGQTFNCNRCHDHKFDPFTQKDFYALKAFFSNVNEQGDGNQDSLILPDAEVQARIAPLAAQARSLEERLARQAAPDAAVQAWAERLARQPAEWTPFEIHSVTAPQGKPSLSGDHREITLSRVGRETKALVAQLKVPAGKKLAAVRLECASEAEGARLTVSRVMLKDAQGKMVSLRGAAEGISQRSSAAEQATKNAARANAILQPGPNQPPEALVWQLAAPPAATSAEAVLTLSFVISSAGRETDWRILFTEAPADQLVEQPVLDIAKLQPDARTTQQGNVLKREYKLALDISKVTRQRLIDLQDRITALRKLQPAAIVMEEREKPKDTFILMRGVYDKPGEKVTAATPAVLPALPEDLPRNRLGLAKWLVSPEHPLTARVTVNRLWQMLFGTGLVRSSEDFGSQGEAPSHPELLDWLAGEFIRSGWDVQHMLRLMMSSATYQQSSQFTGKGAQSDPDNRLLSRGPRFRIHAEFVRDQALAAAGLLSAKVGGKSVQPYHPPGLYELVTAGKGTTRYVQDKGEDLHRRSLYTYWKRSVPHPAMMAFDAPSREVCTVRRPRSNTPLQALNLMNDPVYIEAARHLAQRMIAASPQLDEQIRFGYETLLSRPPNAQELAVLTKAFERNRADFAKEPAATTGLLQTGETGSNKPKTDPAVLAAMTGIASTLLCLDETITKE